jgi:hypothetical protein
VKSVAGVPLDSKRCEVDQGKVAEFYDDLEKISEKIPAEFIWNVDESGCNEWADQSVEYRVLVPDSYDKSWIKVPIDRHSKRSTLVGCIGADGSTMKSMIIVDRTTMEADLELYGYDASKILITSQENAYMTTVLFHKWAAEVFFPTVEEKRQQCKYQGTALLIMDGFGCHHSEVFDRECEARNIREIGRAHV